MKLLVLALLALASLTSGYNYGEILKKSILFYEAQRCGALPGNNRIGWRRSAFTKDGQDVGKDLNGGWFDAGDHVKFNFPMAASVTVLLWGLVDFGKAYQDAGEYQNMLDSVKWPLDYFIRCHVSDNELYGQVGDGNADHSVWERPEDTHVNRPSFKIDTGKPGSDLAGETAAAMAAGSMAFRKTNPGYADELLRHARKLYTFGTQYRGLYHHSITNAKDFYGSHGYKDELAWAAAWLYKATKEDQYLNEAKNLIDNELGASTEFSWDDKAIGACLLTYEADRNHQGSKSKIENFINHWRNMQKTPKGLAWLREWGSCRYAANAALLHQMASKLGIQTDYCNEFAKKQLHYMLGDNGRSYVVGFGNNPPTRPHHRAASCPWPPQSCGWNWFHRWESNPHVLNGALVGGPGKWDEYQDKRSDHKHNEVATDYNAGFQSAVAGLLNPTPIDNPGVIPTGAPPTGVPPTGAPPTRRPGKYNYGEVLGKSILFYEAQRVGTLPGNNRIRWRRSAFTKDGQDVGKDLNGGWFDAGDHVKFNFPMASSVTVLLWGLVEFGKAYQEAGEYENMLDSVKWPLDYFIKCHISDNELYGQVGDGNADHSVWERPEDTHVNRPSFKIDTGKPGSDLAGETAAAMAAGSIAFRKTNAGYADELLRRARKLYTFGTQYRGLYHHSITNAKDFYKSYGYKDELAWAAAWLYKATKEDQYLNEAKNLIDNELGTSNEFSWDDKAVGACLLIYEADKSHQGSKNMIEHFINHWRNMQKTPKGLAWLREWGSCRYAASEELGLQRDFKEGHIPQYAGAALYRGWTESNAALLHQMAAKLGIQTDYCNGFAEKQLHYMLGDNGRSYVVGFGNNPPTRPHHRAASCPNPPQSCGWNWFHRGESNPHVLTGALVGGPGKSDEYVDKRSDHKHNEVATDYNAGFQSAVAGLLNPNPIDGPGVPTGVPPTGVPPTGVPPTGPPVTGHYDYNQVLHKSILFYESQRSGNLPANNRVPWRRSAFTDDGKDVGKDLTGGWHDAGDYVKFNFPMASAVTVLAWGLVEFPEAYRGCNEYDQALDSIKWPLDYFIKCHVSDNELYGQVGDGDADHASWDRPEDTTVKRPSFKIDAARPGSDLAGETSAAMAAGSIAFRSTNAKYADELLEHAKKLYEFGVAHKGFYSTSIQNAGKFYKSNAYMDELAWAAAWLHKATGDEKYLAEAKSIVENVLAIPSELSWDEKTVGASMLIYEADKNHQKSRTMIDGFIGYWEALHKTPKGLAWHSEWGSNRYAANAALIHLMAAKNDIKPDYCKKFAKDQIHYMLGDNGRSYVCGFGFNPPVRPHHRAASCPSPPTACGWPWYKKDDPNPQVITGALVGGPDASDGYTDKRDDHKGNEVAVDYNAGFQSSLAALQNLKIIGQLP